MLRRVPWVQSTQYCHIKGSGRAREGSILGWGWSGLGHEEEGSAGSIVGWSLSQSTAKESQPIETVSCRFVSTKINKEVYTYLV